MHSQMRYHLSVNKYDKKYYWGENAPVGTGGGLLFYFYLCIAQTLYIET